MALSLRWALNAPSVPIEALATDDPVAARCVPPAGGGVATVRVPGNWSLLRLIAKYPPRDTEDAQPSAEDGVPVAFDVPVCANLLRAPGGDDSPGPARIFSGSACRRPSAPRTSPIARCRCCSGLPADDSAPGASMTAADEARVAALLAPVPGAHPAGRDVRDAGDYDRIGEARRDENAALPRGVWARECEAADWVAVERLCTETLTRRSKDLRVACWLCEAWVHRHGFAGLAAGMALIDGLCATWWDGLFPALDGGDTTDRATTIEWLNDRLPVALRQVPIVLDAVQSDEAYGWSDQMAALRLDTIRHQDPASAKKAEAGGAVTLAMIAAVRDRTDGAMLGQIGADLGDALEALGTLDHRLDTLCVAMRRDWAGSATSRPISPPSPRTRSRCDRRCAAAPLPPPSACAVTPPIPTGTPPTTRESAYRQLAMIAAQLRDLDPHSPCQTSSINWSDGAAFRLRTSTRRYGMPTANCFDFARGFGVSGQVEMGPISMNRGLRKNTVERRGAS